ncbi:hypothetical protein JYK00_05285 [Thermosipho ferrireducens]|uniref:Uncharacterized protein n=1 Tax=Thermosipho ferrireducens TaxID=2571116 RepID=A0ABX7S431_9BACT|nr:hypothetical protein [Thermosipho ferrireducens]QTA37166.1 hypothetical protein JYK00_05285 [Thermosipho ferrireducens]
MEKYLTELFSKKIPSNDFVTFNALLFSIGFTTNVFSNVFFKSEFLKISNTIYLLGVLGCLIFSWKWYSVILKNNSKFEIIIYLYVILSIVFILIGYFIPYVFIIPGILVLSLILTVEKFFKKENNETETLIPNPWMSVIFVILTLTFYTVELAPNLNEAVRSKNREGFTDS